MCFKRLKKRIGIDNRLFLPHQCSAAYGDDSISDGHTTLHMTNKYASLTIDHLKKSHERHSLLRADTSRSGDVLGTGYWEE